MIIEITTAAGDPEVNLSTRNAVTALLRRLGYPVDFIESRVMIQGYDAALKIKGTKRHPLRGVDSGPILPPERRKISAGHWKVEGYDVVRATSGRWRISLADKLVHTAPTLSAATEWIVSGGQA